MEEEKTGLEDREGSVPEEGMPPAWLHRYVLICLYGAQIHQAEMIQGEILSIATLSAGHMDIMGSGGKPLAPGHRWA